MIIIPKNIINNIHYLLNILGVNATIYGLAIPLFINQSKSVKFAIKCNVPTFPNLEAIKYNLINLKLNSYIIYIYICIYVLNKAYKYSQIDWYHSI
jgi:hypothetical protein